jgi:uncharacterized membrane protein (UPF0127 family)
MKLLFLLLPALVALTACQRQTIHDFYSRQVTLPDGRKVTCEVMAQPADRARGMMYRDKLAEDRGMLFIHDKPGKYTYWMANVNFPLDIIWMDMSRRVVEIAADVKPCKADTLVKDCPQNGGTQDSFYVLEVNAGVAAKSGVKVGAILDF